MTKQTILLAMISLIMVFVFITAPSVKSLPMLDGNIDFLQVYDVYSKGLDGYIAKWGTVHPPLKMLLGSFVFQIAGFHWKLYHLTGVLVGALGLMIFARLGEALEGKQIAIISTAFLIFAGLYVANTPGWPTDLLVTISLFGALLAYIKKQIISLCVWCVVASLIKETGVLIGISILTHSLIHGIIFIIKKRPIDPLIFGYITAGLLSLVAFFAWQMMLRLFGGEVWNEWNFSSTAEKGTLYTIAANILTLGFLNQYLRQHMLQLFILNYHWVYLGILGVVALAAVLMNLKSSRKAIWHRIKLVFSGAWGVIAIFTFIYCVSVLGFQTYTIPRYALPIQWVFYLLLALAISYFIKIHKPAGIMICSAIFVLMFRSLYSSSDPLSIIVWGTKEVLGERIYDLPSHLAGNDGITYSAQYLTILNRRSRAINLAHQRRDAVRAPSCEFIFPDPNNERRLLSILGFSEAVANAVCLDSFLYDQTD